MLAAVDALPNGVGKNTYVIFSSDNGAQGERWTDGKAGSGPDGTTGGAFSNAVGTQGPFRGTKASLYDGGHRVPFIVMGPGVPKGRVDHSLIGAVDWLPTIASIAHADIPAGTLLRGEDMKDVWHGTTRNRRSRGKPLIMRGGGGPPPCWHHSPALQIRKNDFKLLFNPDPTPYHGGHTARVELYNMSINNLGASGAFFEANNIAEFYPDVVNDLMAEALEWHNASACPYGAASGTCPSYHHWGVVGCEGYAFPGI